MTSIKSNHLIQLVSTLFIFLFVYTAVSKLMEFERFTHILASSPLIGRNNKLVAWLVISAELVASVLLVIPSSRLFGMYGALLIMSVFTAYVGYMVIFTPHLPCSCGGIISKLSWQQHLVLNILLCTLAGLGIKLKGTLLFE